MKTKKPQLRVSSGTAKNKKLKTPDIPGFRPVQEITKQAIFAIIADKIQNATCLDLFAGSGNMGIEALSRGAKWCDFVDNHAKATQAIEENLFTCDFTASAEVIRAEAVKYSANTSQKYDIIFMDPFYDDTAQVFLMKQIEQILNPDGMVFILYGKQLNLSATIKDTHLEPMTTRRFGASYFSQLRHISPILQKTKNTA